MLTTQTPARGRFAPSPTGPLHFGSLLAAVASFLHARHQDGQWLVRIEDIDPPREVRGAADAILRTLEAYGLEWDGPVIYQGRRRDLYETCLDRLRRDDRIYYCTCSRQDLLQTTKPGDINARYPGYCRGHVQPRPDSSIRVRTDDRDIRFQDLCQGLFNQRLASETGDFVIKRRDGLFAYQLAVVADDGEQGITEVVRGCDLLDSTPRQIYLQQVLDLPTPSYLHIPIAVTPQGHKLSKGTGAPAIDNHRPVDNLLKALRFLGQQPPDELRDASPGELLGWALSHWSPARIPSTRTLPYDDKG